MLRDLVMTSWTIAYNVGKLNLNFTLLEKTHCKRHLGHRAPIWINWCFIYLIIRSMKSIGYWVGFKGLSKCVCVCVYLQILFPCRLMFKQIVDNIMVVLQTTVCPDFSIGPDIISTCFLMHYEYEFWTGKDGRCEANGISYGQWRCNFGKHIRETIRSKVCTLNGIVIRSFTWDATAMQNVVGMHIFYLALPTNHRFEFESWEFRVLMSNHGRIVNLDL